MRVKQNVGIALSGGGSRAIAFHLGCLRALHQLNVLQSANAISAVSGGSVLAGLYLTKFTGDFDKFEDEVRQVLRRGLVRPTVRTALVTWEGPIALLCWCLVLANGAFIGLGRLVARHLSSGRSREYRDQSNSLGSFRRFASRTTIFRSALERELFGGARLDEGESRPGPKVTFCATELRTGAAFYFSGGESGCWRFGKLANNDISVAHAVAASAAHPLFLPALDESLVFVSRDGECEEERVLLADGGVYDNLALSLFWPNRDPTISVDADKRIDRIICCRAGYSLRKDPVPYSAISRLRMAFNTVHTRAQNLAAGRLFDLHELGPGKGIVGFAMPYLGQDDTKLRYAPPDLVSRDNTGDYPTDFSAMAEDWIDRLAKRGEQLTMATIQEHMPSLFEAT